MKPKHRHTPQSRKTWPPKRFGAGILNTIETAVYNCLFQGWKTHMRDLRKHVSLIFTESSKRAEICVLDDTGEDWIRVKLGTLVTAQLEFLDSPVAADNIAQDLRKQASRFEKHAAKLRAINGQTT